jgi:hypothetical protein
MALELRQRARVQLEQVVVVIVGDGTPLAIDARAAFPHVQPQAADTGEAGLIVRVVDLECVWLQVRDGSGSPSTAATHTRQSGRSAP